MFEEGLTGACAACRPRVRRSDSPAERVLQRRLRGGPHEGRARRVVPHEWALQRPLAGGGYPGGCPLLGRRRLGRRRSPLAGRRLLLARFLAWQARLSLSLLCGHPPPCAYAHVQGAQPLSGGLLLLQRRLSLSAQLVVRGLRPGHVVDGVLHGPRRVFCCCAVRAESAAADLSCYYYPWFTLLPLMLGRGRMFGCAHCTVHRPLFIKKIFWSVLMFGRAQLAIKQKPKSESNSNKSQSPSIHLPWFLLAQ